MRQRCITAADQYLQVQRRQRLPLLPWVAFVLLDGPGRLTALPVRHAGKPQVRVQRAAFHVGLDGGRVGVRREHLLDQVGFLWRFRGPMGLRELVLPFSFSLQVEREEQRGRQGLFRRRRRNLPLQSHSNRHCGWVWQRRQTRPLCQMRLAASIGASSARLRANPVSQGGLCFDNDANTLGESAERNWRQSAIGANKGSMLSERSVIWLRDTPSPLINNMWRQWFPFCSQGTILYLKKKVTLLSSS